MKPTANGHSVRAVCSTCEAITSFEFLINGREHGTITMGGFPAVTFRLLRCAGCGRGAIAEFSEPRQQHPLVAPQLLSFHPRAATIAALPDAVPAGIAAEFREAEKCANAGAWRGASALIRSALEKALAENGYTNGGLQAKIDLAATDGVITAARARRAHEDVRVLGNEVVHDEWRAVDEDEVEQALHYTQRILEDLYDDRATVEKTLIVKGRMKAP